MKKDWVS